MSAPAGMVWDDEAQAYVPAEGAAVAAQQASDAQPLGSAPPSDPFGGAVQDPFGRPPSPYFSLAAALCGSPASPLPPLTRAEQIAAARARVEHWTRKLAELESADDPEPPLAA